MLTPTNLDEPLGDVAEKPLRLDVRCAQCQVETSIEVPWVMLDHNAFARVTDRSAPRERDEGIVLGRIFTCPSCGAIDDYRLSGGSSLALSAALLTRLSGATDSRIELGIPQLWDGTVLRRPSQGLARLREITANRPDDAEAWRRLGNYCERFGLLEEAQSAWRTAVEKSPKEFDAALLLADVLSWGNDPEAAKFIFLAIQRLPFASFSTGEQRRGTGELLADMTWALVDQLEKPLGLRAAWMFDAPNGSKGALVELSDVNLSAIRNRGGLAVFFAMPRIVSIEVTRAPEEAEPTMLQELIEYLGSPVADLDWLGAKAEPIRVPPRPGRNEPCPCGSGNKYKRCHGR